MALQAFAQAKALAARGRLEDVEATVKDDLPARVGNDGSGMCTT